MVTNSTELNLFVKIITKEEELPESLKHLLDLYNQIKDRVKKEGKRIIDISSLGKSFYGKITGINEYEYSKALNQLAMYETTCNKTKWPEFFSEKEKREHQKKSIVEVKFPTSEKEHFREELLLLGDQAEEIVGGSYNITPVILISDYKKSKKAFR